MTGARCARPWRSSTTASPSRAERPGPCPGRAARAGRRAGSASTAVRALAPDRHDPFLRTLAEHPHRAVFEIEIVEVETDRLADADAGRRTRARAGPGRAAPEGSSPATACNRRSTSSSSSALGMPGRNRRRSDLLARIALDESLPRAEAVERSHRHDRRATDDAASTRRPSSSTSVSRWRTYSCTTSSPIGGRIRLAPRPQEIRVAPQVAPVSGQRVPRQPTLDDQPVVVLGEQTCRQFAPVDRRGWSSRGWSSRGSPVIRRPPEPAGPSCHVPSAGAVSAIGSRGRRPSARSSAELHERREQRVRTVRTALELGVRLGGDEERVHPNAAARRTRRAGHRARFPTAPSRSPRRSGGTGCSARSDDGAVRTRPLRRRSRAPGSRAASLAG